MTNETKCELCGEPMPPGEEMFTYHGYSGPCPKPPLGNTEPLPSRQIGTLTAHIAALESELAALRQVVADVETCRGVGGENEVTIFGDIDPAIVELSWTALHNDKCFEATTWQAALHAAAEQVRNTNPERTDP